MKKPPVKGSLLAALFLLPVLSWAQALELKTIKLNEPNKKRGLAVMEALSVRASVREWSDRELSLQDLSDLLWAANGINRPDSKKRTASSAQNAQDVDIYVFRKDGVYLYDAIGHGLVPVAAVDQRSQIGMAPGGGPVGPGVPGTAGRSAEAQAGRPAGAQARRAAVLRANPVAPGLGRFPIRRRNAGAET